MNIVTINFSPTEYLAVRNVVRHEVSDGMLCLHGTRDTNLDLCWHNEDGVQRRDAELVYRIPLPAMGFGVYPQKDDDY